MSAPREISDLVDRFAEHAEAYRSGAYNETQLRREFVDPMFEALGWDMYLLDPNHRAGKSKARFFLSHGFTVERWQELAEALRRHARENDIANQERTPLGERFVVEGPLPPPDGGVASVRSIWFV